MRGGGGGEDHFKQSRTGKVLLPRVIPHTYFTPTIFKCN